MPRRRNCSDYWKRMPYRLRQYNEASVKSNSGFDHSDPGDVADGDGTADCSPVAAKYPSDRPATSARSTETGTAIAPEPDGGSARRAQEDPAAEESNCKCDCGPLCRRF